MSHRCPAPECHAEITGFVCATHWRELPIGIRDEINRARRNGQRTTQLQLRAIAHLRADDSQPALATPDHP